MPIYTYYCKKCKKQYSQIQLIDKRDKSKCPICNTKGTRLIESPPFHLKGTGWYKTDY